MRFALDKVQVKPVGRDIGSRLFRQLRDSQLLHAPDCLCSNFFQ